MTGIPGYKIIEQVHDGRSSVVYRAQRLNDGLPVILKTLKEDYVSSEELARYQREFEMRKNLDVECVVQVFSLENHHHRPVLVMEDFGGLDLRTVGESRSLSLSDKLKIAVSSSEALGKIHQANIIHKDIKPSNILFNPDTGRVKITDLGLASQVPRETPGLLHQGQLIGSLPYMSPEQTGRMNRLVDWRTDLYSLGVTFYQLLTGRLPFESTDALELVHAHMARMPKSPHEANEEIPVTVSKIVMKLLAKNADDRYQSAWGLKADLEECLKQYETAGLIEPFPLGLQDISDRFQIPQKLYGRKKEIDKLMAAFDRVSQGRKELMLVTGEPGIGKTTLVHEIYKPITEVRGYFISGKFDQFQRNVPYSAIIQAFGELIRQLLAETEERLVEWRNRIQSAVGNIGQVVIDVIPEVELIIGPQPELTEIGPQETQNRFVYVFQNFVRLFCQPEHPLVVFFDDLQWADGASLKFLELMLTDESICFLLVIGTYRDNEVEPGHPLLITIEHLKKEASDLQRITLDVLSPDQILALTADVLWSDKESIIPLTELIINKTAGNPFFIREFLGTLYGDDLLVFAPHTSSWTWDIEQIKAVGITDNVVDLMTKHIRRLKPDIQNILMVASALGPRFEIDLLASVIKKPIEEVVTFLDEAVVVGLIIQQQMGYKFSHDRIQQAAYSLITESERSAFHLKIGDLLLDITPVEKLEERIFTIVHQLNQGIESITDMKDRYKVAELNLMSGKESKASAAWEPAYNYLKTGLSLLAPDSWITNYSLTLDIHVELANVAFTLANFAEVTRLFEIVIDRARKLVDKLYLYEIRMKTILSQGRYPEALQIGLSILKQLGIVFPAKPTYLRYKIDALTNKIIIKSKDEIPNIPPMEDDQLLWAFRIGVLVISAAYMTSPKLNLFIASKFVRLIQRYGHPPQAPFIYIRYSGINCVMSGDLNLAYNLGQAAMELMEIMGNKKSEASAIHGMNLTVRHWKEHLKETIPFLWEAFEFELESGDIRYAGFTSMVIGLNMLHLGKDLITIKKEIERLLSTINRFRQETPTHIHGHVKQTIENLLGFTDCPWLLTGDSYAEETSVKIMIENNDHNALMCYYLHKMMLAFLFQQYNILKEIIYDFEQYTDGAIGTYYTALNRFYNSLSLLTFDLNEKRSEKRRILRKVKSNQRKMKKWAYHAPMNFLHKYHLVEAERCRVLGKQFKAMEYYDLAIKRARENEYIHEEALANELAAKFYLEIDRFRVSRAYMQEARRCYQQWGAVAKVQHLDNTYFELLKDEIAISAGKTASETTSTSSSGSEATLDLSSIMKASQAISGEIHLDQLLRQLMSIIMESAGAGRGFLILTSKGRLVIEAQTRIGQEPSIFHTVPVEGNQELSSSIINFVARTQETVILEDAANKGKFIHDLYVQNNKPKSILCSPLVHQGKLTGIVYLENNLTIGAFTKERIEVLNLLCSQAAISLENARLYGIQKEHAQMLEQKVEERTSELRESLNTLTRTQSQLVQSEKMAALGNLVAGVAHEVNTPVGIAVTAASHLDEKTKELNHIIASGSLRRSDLENYTKTASDSSRLILSNLQRASEIVQGFKQVAVDQTSEERRRFNIKTYIEDVLQSLHPKLKKAKHTVNVQCPDDLEVDSFPGAFSQIITNLIMNSLIHGFEDKDEGKIQINITKENGNLLLKYHDDGKGIDEKTRKKIFDPFYTTRRSSGGSGLGMHIVFNLVTKTLGGKIECYSVPGQGIQFVIGIPNQEGENA